MNIWITADIIRHVLSFSLFYHSRYWGDGSHNKMGVFGHEQPDDHTGVVAIQSQLCEIYRNE